MAFVAKFNGLRYVYIYIYIAVPQLSSFGETRICIFGCPHICKLQIGYVKYRSEEIINYAREKLCKTIASYTMISVIFAHSFMGSRGGKIGGKIAAEVNRKNETGVCFDPVLKERRLEKKLNGFTGENLLLSSQGTPEERAGMVVEGYTASLLSKSRNGNKYVHRVLPPDKSLTSDEMSFSDALAQYRHDHGLRSLPKGFSSDNLLLPNGRGKEKGKVLCLEVKKGMAAIGYSAYLQDSGVQNVLPPGETRLSKSISLSSAMDQFITEHLRGLTATLENITDRRHDKEQPLWLLIDEDGPINLPEEEAEGHPVYLGSTFTRIRALLNNKRVREPGFNLTIKKMRGKSKKEKNGFVLCHVDAINKNISNAAKNSHTAKQSKATKRGKKNSSGKKK